MTQLPWNNVIGRITAVYDVQGGEIATNTFYVAAVNDALAVSVLDVDDLTTCCTVVRDRLETMINGDLSFYNGFKLNRVDGYQLAAAAPHDALAKRTVGGTNKPGGSGTALPPEVAAACSLYGYNPANFEEQRARRRGRVFIPGLAINAITGTGMFTTAFGNWVANNIAGMADDLWDADLSSDLHGDLVVASRTGNYLTEVALTRVDNHPDVQRRRQNRLAYAYSVADVDHVS